MDLSQAMEVCRGGMYVRDDLLMSPNWVIYFDKVTKEFYYINPKTGPSYRVRFSDEMKASVAWRALAEVPKPPAPKPQRTPR